jgi:hypothetical protein
MDGATVTGGCTSDGGAIPWIGIRRAAQITSILIAIMAIPIHHQRGFFVFLILVLLFFAKTSLPSRGQLPTKTVRTAFRADKPIGVTAIISRICFAICLLGDIDLV